MAGAPIGKNKGKEMPVLVDDFEGVLNGCAFGCLEATPTHVVTSGRTIR